MSKKESAGILLYRLNSKGLEVFLVHPGGPFWKKKDIASWTIPKGEITKEEEALGAAIREFKEETGFDAVGPFQPLTVIRQSSGKWVHAFASPGDLVPALLRSNTVTLEWPPRSGRKLTFPEVDRGEWFPVATARDKILPAQVPFLNELEKICDTPPPQIIAPAIP